VSAYDGPQKFSDEVIASLDDIKIDYNYEKETRTDLRDQLIITIDGKDAKT
jgi:exoribonuclease R